MSYLPRLFRLALLSMLVYLALFLLLRLAFAAAFYPSSDPLTPWQFAEALRIGSKFDLRLAIFIVLPLLLLGSIPQLNPLRHRLAARLWSLYFALMTTLVAIFYSIDFGYFAYLNTRLDSFALTFVENPDTSLLMVWQSYPVIAIVLALLAAVALVTWLMHQLIAIVARQTETPLRWPLRLGRGALLGLLLLLGIYGSLTWYPLRWSDAFFSSHRFVSALALNPVLYFYDTWRIRAPGSDSATLRNYYPAVAAWLRADPIDSDMLNLSRPLQPQTKPAEAWNVVIVILESFAGYKSSMSNNPLDPTPNIAELTANSHYFPNFFVPHTGTARSVFAFVTGIPDVQIGDTSSRNPMIVNQHTLLNAFRDHQKFYFLGGSASWRNIRALFANNVAGIEIYEEGRYSSPRIDVWGISDLALFQEANQILKNQKQPFVAVIQTSGNHRPYTLPTDNGGFVVQQVDESTIRQHGFESAAEYNSFRFMDHAVGEFMRLAREAGYYHNTLFAFFGDHGINGYAGNHMPPAESQLDLGSWRVPLILHAPALLPARIDERLATELDLLPSLASLTGQPMTVTTLGRDLFDPRYDGDRYAFTFQYGATPILGLLSQEGWYVTQHADGSHRSLHQISSPTPRDNLWQAHGAKGEEMSHLLSGIYTAARYLLENNPPRPSETAPPTQ
jgi:phosphoglycerol transferase MdoB-like AlkP superfamily enzyme